MVEAADETGTDDTVRRAVILIGLLSAGVLPGTVAAKRIAVPIYPYDEHLAEAGQDAGPALPLEVRVSVPDAGRIARESRTTSSWTGLRDNAGCRVRITVEARAESEIDPDIEEGQPPHSWFSRSGVRVAVSSVALDDTRSPFAYARLRLPDKLAPSSKRRVVYVLVSSSRGQGHCTRRLRARGTRRIRHALRTIAVHRR